LGDTKLEKLFEQTQIKKITLKNRFIRSATWEGLANTDGSCSSKVTDIMVRLANDNVALIISGHAYVNKDGQARINQLGIYNDHLIPSYLTMVDRVHQYGSKVLLQLSHGGYYSATHLTGLPAMAPSLIKNSNFKNYKVMSIDDIKQTVCDFKTGAIRAYKSGFDGIQLHAAHGYLLSEFLSPHFNNRKDQYGGNIINRTRIISDIVQGIRKDLGKEFFISVKINSEDFLEDGFTRKDMLKTSKILEKDRIDAIELSGGMGINESRYKPSGEKSKKTDQLEEVYYEKAAELYKNEVKIPLILVGGIRSYFTSERLIKESKADYISFCRPLIAEPNLVSRWEKENRSISKCISCNQCLRYVREGKGLKCVLFKNSNI